MNPTQADECSRVRGRRVGTLAVRRMPTVVALTLLGCAADIAAGDELLEGEHGAASTQGDIPGMSFETPAQAYSWIAERAVELGMDVRERTDARGEVIGISGLSLGSSKDVQLKRAALLDELGGSERTVRIAGKAYSLGSAPDEELGVARQALCSGGLCTSHSSYRDNYFFYREIGSRTNVTSGGFELRRQTIQGSSYLECIDYPGPLPVTCTGYCSYAQGCPAGLTVESTQGYPTCRRVCSGNVSNVNLTLTAQAFEWVGSVLVPSFGKTQTTQSRSLEVSFWEAVIPGTSSAIGDAAGLCGTHVTTGPNGAVVSGNSRTGPVPSSCL
jgi:hypothetical protein